MNTRNVTGTWIRIGAAALAAMVTLSSQAAFASQSARTFYDGAWNCNLHGRSAKMLWKTVSASRHECRGDGTCSVTSGVKKAGFFRDGSGPWVNLEELSSSHQSITFRHADGNKWYLANHGNGQISGHSTWQGHQYPLSCWR